MTRVDPAVTALEELPIRDGGKWIPPVSLGQAVKDAFLKGYSAEFIMNKVKEASPDTYIPSAKTIVNWLRTQGVDTAVPSAERAAAWRQAHP